MKRIPVSRLRIGMVLDEDIYSANNPAIPLIRRGSVLDWSLMTKMLRHNIKAVAISDGTNSDEIIIEKKISTPSPLADLYAKKPKPIIESELKEEALTNLEELFYAVTIAQGDLHEASVKIITHLDTVVDHLVGSLEKDPSALVNINDLKSYDEYTYHHSLSVAVLSISIGQYLGFSGERLNHLAKCAILHDIGKTAVPIEIINKPSRLDNHEFKIIQNHSAAGYDYLSSREIGDEELWLGVMHHHEKYDGSGYPNGMGGADIPVLSRIVSVADVYDALTSNRPYRKPMQPAEAIEYIMGGVYSSFDYDMVDAFVKRVNLYPEGCVIELSNHQYAIVVDTHNHMRPTVRTLNDGKILDLYNDHSCLSLVISRVVPEDEYPMLLAE